MPLLIRPDALAGRDDCVIFDCRFALTDPTAGRRLYGAGHIPGAHFADLEQNLSSAPGTGGRHPLPDRDRLADWLRDCGVNSDSPIVCYDQNSGALACRLWWLVRWLGHAEVSVLDGGLDAWTANGFALSTAEPDPEPGNFAAGPALTRSCTAAKLLDMGVPVLDAREAARYRGESEPIDPVAGHIPGAISAPFSENLADGHFRSPEQLRSRFNALGVAPGSSAACYCGSGVTATHNILALLLAGFPEPILYPGSWSEWIADPSRPIASG